MYIAKKYAALTLSGREPPRSTSKKRGKREASKTKKNQKKSRSRKQRLVHTSTKVVKARLVKSKADPDWDLENVKVIAKPKVQDSQTIQYEYPVLENINCRREPVCENKSKRLSSHITSR